MIKQFLFAITIYTFSVGALAAPTGDELIKLRTQIKTEQKNQEVYQKKADSVAAEVADVQENMIKTGTKIQTYEEMLSDLEKNITDLEIKQTSVQKRLKLRESQMAGLMQGLQKMALNPPQVLYLQPANPTLTLKSALLLKESRKPLQASLEKLKDDLNRLSSLQAAIRAQATQIKVAASRLSEQQENMEKLVQQKSILQTQFETHMQSSKRKSEELGKQARNLEDLIKRLETERRRAQEQRVRQLAERAFHLKPIKTQERIFEPLPDSFSKAKGKLTVPAKGALTQGFGAMTDAGFTTKGLTFTTRPKAQVIAPFDGVVLFAGPFKSYKNLLIIEHGNGYHSLIAGLDRIHATVGQNIKSNEPIGVMPSHLPQLYVELRHDSQPINPTEWFSYK